MIVVLVTCGMVASCAKKDAPETSRHEAGRTRDRATGATTPADSLEVRIVFNERGYAMREKIVMTLVARNTTARPLLLTFPTAQRFDFIVTDGKQIVWQWSHGRMFAQARSRHTIAPHDSITYEFTWDQIANDGTEPRLGRYTIQGVLKIDPEIASTKHVFGIVD